MRKVILSETEKDIAYMMSLGYTVQQIADELCITKEQLEWKIVKIKQRLHHVKNSEIARDVIRGKIDVAK